MSNKTFALDNENYAGNNPAKQRLTILLCADIEGEKEDRSRGRVKGKIKIDLKAII